MIEQAFGAVELPPPLNGIVMFLACSTWLLLNLGVIMVNTRDVLFKSRDSRKNKQP
jgi:hypothetical protein